MSKRQKPDPKQIFNSLGKELHELVSNKTLLRTSLEQFLNNLVDEMTIGIIFDLHRKHKTNAYDLEVDVDDSADEDETTADVDVFSQHNMKKTPDCVCPICETDVAASRFASHLEKCMGMGRKSRSRNASRRVVTDSKDSSSYSGVPSDDDDDLDWNSRDKRRKKKNRNGSKKSKGTPKKTPPDPSESVNVDVEGDDDDLTILRDILHLRDCSNNTSPVDSASSSHTGSSKKKEKSKNKKSIKRDRSSPSSSAVD